MNRLISIVAVNEILPEYSNIPIGLLPEYHNLKCKHDTYENAQFLAEMCMDNRRHLHTPDNFSYIIRTGGANPRYQGIMAAPYLLQD